MEKVTITKLIKELIKRTKKNRGKACPDLKPSCLVCRATILISFLEDELNYQIHNK